MTGVVELMRGFVVAKTVYLAAESGVADLIAEGIHDVGELARRTGANADALGRIMRALSAVDVFYEREAGHFELGPLGEQLRTDAPGSLRNWVRMNGDTIFGAFADADATLRTGRPAVESSEGKPFFEWLEGSPARASVFDAAMRDFARVANEHLLEAYDFSDVETLVDVGGGSGALLMDVLVRHQRVCGILFDRPEVVERAREGFRGAGLEGRVRLVGGDFFESVVPGGDAYVLSWILHDWQDAEAHTILRSCRRAMSPGARLLVLEAVLPATDEPHFARFGDIVMLVALGGRERTLAEYDALLAANGFAIRRKIDTGAPRSVIEAVAVEDA